MNTAQATSHAIKPEQNTGAHMKGLAILTAVSMMGIAVPLYGLSNIVMIFIK